MGRGLQKILLIVVALLCACWSPASKGAGPSSAKAKLLKAVAECQELVHQRHLELAQAKISALLAKHADNALSSAPGLSEGTKDDVRYVISTRRLRGKASDSFNFQPAKPLAAIRADGQIELGEQQLFHVHSMLPGRISQDQAMIGKYFRKGDLIALMESAELVHLSAEFVRRMEENEMSVRQCESKIRLAKAELERVRKLVSEGIAAEKEMLQSQESLRTVSEDLEDLNEQRVLLQQESQTLANLYGTKMPRLGKKTLPSELPLNAPNDGILVKKNVSLGDRVNPDEPAYILADLSKIRLRVVLPIVEQKRLAIGQLVAFSCSQISKKSFSGRVRDITASEALEKVSVIIDLENPQGLLRASMSGQARIFVN